MKESWTGIASLALGVWALALGALVTWAAWRLIWISELAEQSTLREWEDSNVPFFAGLLTLFSAAVGALFGVVSLFQRNRKRDGKGGEHAFF